MALALLDLYDALLVDLPLLGVGDQTPREQALR